MAKRKRKMRAAAPLIDCGVVPTPERMLQFGGIVRELVPITANSRQMQAVYRAKAECKLDRYRLRGAIGSCEFEAGMKFRAAWLYLTEGIKITDSTQREASDDICINAQSIAHLRPYSDKIIREAWSVLSPIQKIVITSVCGEDQPVGVRMAQLRAGLERMRIFWKIN